jgi:hypothetical protein
VDDNPGPLQLDRVFAVQQGGDRLIAQPSGRPIVGIDDKSHQ